MRNQLVLLAAIFCFIDLGVCRVSSEQEAHRQRRKEVHENLENAAQNLADAREKVKASEPRDLDKFEPEVAKKRGGTCQRFGGGRTRGYRRRKRQKRHIRNLSPRDFNRLAKIIPHQRTSRTAPQNAPCDGFNSICVRCCCWPRSSPST